MERLSADEVDRAAIEFCERAKAAGYVAFVLMVPPKDARLRFVTPQFPSGLVVKMLRQAATEYEAQEVPERLN